jgi:multidrug resistance efflux pump
MPEKAETNENSANPVPTQEAYDALVKELETAKASVDQASLPLKERIASLESDLKARGEDMVKSQATVAEKDKSFASLTANYEGAVTAYKGQVLKANPLVPAELVTGTTIQEIEASVARASAIVTRIKDGITQQNQTIVVPAGAPGRTEPDISGLSTREKITSGLEAKRKAK